MMTFTAPRWPRILFALRACSLLVAGLLLAGASGCGLIERCTHCNANDPPPPQAINDVLAIWDPRVFNVADTQQRGRTMTGLAGRIYLLSETEKKMEEATGNIVVELYDMTKARNGGEPVKLVDWHFDPVSLKKLKRTDQLGEGYTLFLPWETYRPDIRHIKLQLAYVEPNGAPHYSEPTLVTLKDHDAVAIQQFQSVPALQQVTQKK